MGAGKKTRRVFVVATVSVQSGRNLVSGVFNHLESGDRDWLIDLFQDGNTVTPEAVRAAAAKGLDGFLVSLPCSEEAYVAIAETGLPCVIVHGRGVGSHFDRMRFVVNDGEAIGRKAAEHLLSAGDFASFAFDGGDTPEYWAFPRLKGFAAALRAKGHAVEVFHESGAKLRDWLRALPRPAAVFASYDVRKDDAALRKDPGSFESLRKHYPVRREFPAYRIGNAEKISPAARSVLRSLGFAGC